MFEVHRELLREKGATTAERFLSYALRLGTRCIALDANMALLAARTSLEHTLGMVDAIIYAPAQLFRAQLVTTDADFQGKPGVTML
jgi:predicted nucleic acid-binding protein